MTKIIGKIDNLPLFHKFSRSFYQHQSLLMIILNNHDQSSRIFGVMNMSRSVFLTSSVLLVNNSLKRGISPRSQTLFSITVLLSFTIPPRTTVSPGATLTVVRTSRMLVMGCG